MILVLMGYMGSGKSTIGKDLASILDYQFIDLDDFISTNENSSISNIFNSKGEIYFRKKESFYLEEIIKTKSNIVLALGGGTPCYGQNIKLLNDTKSVKSFYLQLAIPLLTKRLFLEKDKRPLISHLKSEEALLEFIGKHLFERVQYYNKATFIINTDNKTKQDIIEEILMQLI
jgi:shikimate kinase